MPEVISTTRPVSGYGRVVGMPEYPPQPLPEIEQRRQAIEARERPAAEARYRQLVFQYAERDLSDGEVVELAGVADKLGLPAGEPDKNRAAILEAKRIQKTIDAPDPDIEASEKSAAQAEVDAMDEMAKTAADYFRCAPNLATARNALTQVELMAGWLRVWRQTLPDRQVDALIRAAVEKKLSAEYARNRKPQAEIALSDLHRDNQILWPA